ncbi:MAG: sulfite exporter TauE/SafE family protein [Actinobacteria bacterium]|nr:MAG: sulfite exporter TauE/SafE family protein [Actinomycetota bacterium]
MPLFLLEAILVGFLAGYFSGQFGIGGGVLTTPAIRLILGYPALIAVGTPLVIILPTAVAGAYQYARKGLVDWALGLKIAPTGMVGVLVGSYLTRFTGGEVVMIATSLVLVAVAFRMIYGKEPILRAPQRSPMLPYLIGLVTGLFSGFLGLGGGLLMVPAFSGVMGRGIKTSFGTSLVLISVFALPGAAVHYALGHVDLRLALTLSLGVVPGAWVGARVAIGAQERVLRLAFGVFLIVVALLLAGTEIARTVG